MVVGQDFHTYLNNLCRVKNQIFFRLHKSLFFPEKKWVPKVLAEDLQLHNMLVTTGPLSQMPEMVFGNMYYVCLLSTLTIWVPIQRSAEEEEEEKVKMSFAYTNPGFE